MRLEHAIKPWKRYRVQPLLGVSLLACLVCVAAPAWAGKVAYMDIKRQWHIIDSSQWSQAKTEFLRYSKAEGMAVRVFHNDTGTGIGFDDPAHGADRLATVESVLGYLNAVILNTGSVDIEFAPSIVEGQGGYLAAATTFFEVDLPGYTSGVAFDHITTGIDVDSRIPDIVVFMDFGYNWNSEIDIPSNTEYDLYSVLLHEFTHGLGLLSLVDANGLSELTGTNPGPFAVYETFLQTGNGKMLFGPGGNFLGAPTDLVGGDNGIFYIGANAVAAFGSPPPIYTPDPYQSGSSISHFDLGIPGGAVMEPAIAAGVMKRFYKNFEVGVLADIGYQVPQEGVPTPTPIPVEPTHAVLYGAQSRSGQILVIDADSGNVLKTFPPPEDAPLQISDVDIGLTIGDRGRSLYYVNGDSNPGYFYELDPENGAMRHEVRIKVGRRDKSVIIYRIPTSLSGLAFFRPNYFTDNSYLVGSQRFFTLFRIRDDDGRVILPTYAHDHLSYFFDNFPAGRAVGGDDVQEVYASSSFFFGGQIMTGGIYSVDPVSGATPYTVLPPPSLFVEGLAFDGKTLFASDNAGKVFHIDPLSGSIRKTITVAGGGLYGLAVRDGATPTPLPSARPGSPTPFPSPTRTGTPGPSPTKTPTPSMTSPPLPTATPRVVVVMHTELSDLDPVSIAAGDLDGVNHDDLATANYRSDNVSVLFNDGSGFFTGSLQSLPTGEGSKPAFVTIGDLDSNGSNDLLVLTVGDSRVLAFTNSGGGQFGTPQELAVPVNRPLGAFIGDLNGDNQSDLAIANSDTDDLTVALNPGTGGGLLREDLATKRVPVGGKLPNDVAGGILRPGEMILDLVTSNWEDNTVSVLLGTGDTEGSFQAPVVYSVGVNPRDVEIADIDGDGFNDVVVACQGAPQTNFSIPGEVTVLFNDGSGRFSTRASVIAGSKKGPADAVPLDFDKDAELDVAVVDLGSLTPLVPGDLTIAYGYRSSPSSPVEFRDVDRTLNIGLRPISLTLGALNGSVRDDLAVANQVEGTIGVLAVSGPAKRAEHADLNRDGSSDVLDLFFLSAIGSRTDSRVRELADLNGDDVLDENDLLWYLRVRGNPVPARTSQKEGDTASGKAPASTGEAGDLNGDGSIDLDDVLSVF